MNKLISYGFLFVGLTFALLAVPSEVETIAFAYDSDTLVETTAEVTANYTRKHQKGPDTQMVKYIFRVDGEKVRGDNQLTRLTDRPYEIERLVHRRDGRETIQVFYRAEDPSVSAIRKDIGLWVPAGIIVFTAFCLFVGVTGVLAREPEPLSRPSTG